MAITYLTGIPRSGKSYYAVYKLYRYFVEKKQQRPFLIGFFYRLLKKRIKKENRKSFITSLYNTFGKKEKVYYCAYTNINQFDFSKTSRIRPFDYEKFYSHLELLHAMYLSKKNDSELLSYARENELYNIIVVIDECQNFFAKDNIVLTWWFTYHGHLHQDIFLITQNLGLIYKEYFKLSEFFFRAIPPSNRLLTHKFRYMQFNSHNLYKTDKIGAFNVPMLNEVFGMYVSGASNNSKSIVVKYFLFALLLLGLLIFLISYFFGTFTPEPTTPSTVEHIDQNKTIQDQPQKTVISQDKKQTPKDIKEAKKLQKKDDNETKNELFEIRCIDMLCSYKGVDFPKPLLNKLTSKLEPEFIWFFNDGSYIQYFVMLPSDTFDFLQKIEKEKSQKGAYNEKSTTKESKSSNNHMPLAVPTHK